MKLLLDTAFGFGIVSEILAYQLLYKGRSVNENLKYKMVLPAILS